MVQLIDKTPASQSPHSQKKCRRNPSPHNLTRLSSAESSLQVEISNARTDFESSLVHDFAFSNDSRIYDYIRTFSKSGGIPSSLQYQSQLITSAPEKANAFNNFFHSVFNHSSAEVAPDKLPHPDHSLSSISITIEDTFQVLSSLNPSKAMGGDGIPPVILQRCAVSLIEPVHHLLSQCLSQSYLPKEWRNHYITPIPKSKDRSQVTNYRPISLLLLPLKSA